MDYRLRHLVFAHPGRPIFTDLDLEFAAGRFHGVIGPNGCGKSTLLDLLGGLKRPDHGQISWKDEDLAQLPPKALARRIAVVPQDFHIDFPFTAGEVVMMGRYPRLARFEAPSASDRERVAAVMARTETSAFMAWRITELSGGERQRVIFAPGAMALFCLETAGGINVATDAQVRPNNNIALYGQEKILSHAHEIDVYLAQVGVMNKVTREEIKGAPGFAVIRAVAMDQIHLIEEELVSRPTPRLLTGIYQIGRRLYPQQFDMAGAAILEQAGRAVSKGGSH